MAGKYLGPRFDIHGGGLDLRFPHHENELAQSKAAGQDFAQIWMHNGMVNLGGSKMAKSVGNTLMVSEVVKRVPAAALRYYLVAAHYRSMIEFSEEALAEAAIAHARLEGFVHRAVERVGAGELGEVPVGFAEAMDDDLSVPAALAVLHAEVAEGHRAMASGDDEALAPHLARVRSMLDALGLDPVTWAGERPVDDTSTALAVLVDALVEQRSSAKVERDFATADRVRDQLTAAGIELEDTPSGTRWTVKGAR